MSAAPVIIKRHSGAFAEGAAGRFKDGYNYFVRYPEKVIAFFDKHMN